LQAVAVGLLMKQQFLFSAARHDGWEWCHHAAGAFPGSGDRTDLLCAAWRGRKKLDRCRRRLTQGCAEAWRGPRRRSPAPPRPPWSGQAEHLLGAGCAMQGSAAAYDVSRHQQSVRVHRIRALGLGTPASYTTVLEAASRPRATRLPRRLTRGRRPRPLASAGCFLRNLHRGDGLKRPVVHALKLGSWIEQ
jgi:hypothetical protein